MKTNNLVSSALILITLITSNTIFARSWDKIIIPNAYCGDGKPYRVFLDVKKKSDQMLIEFMGGGACWDEKSCFGVDIKTWLHPIPKVPAFSYLTSDFWGYSNHPFKDDSALYFPYCNGDVHAGNHIANYNGKKVYHTGRKNVELALEFLAKKKLIPYSKIKRLTVWGASAGAIGSFVHLENVDKYFPQTLQKNVIFDSPGLHFGPTFWNKFSSELQADFKDSFNRIGLFYDTTNGFVAPYMGPVFERFKNWRIGILQGTRDLVMSNSFGDISPDEHEALVLSDKGILAISKPYPNVSVWLKRTKFHTFLLLRTTSNFENDQDQSARKFVKNLVENFEVQSSTNEEILSEEIP